MTMTDKPTQKPIKASNSIEQLYLDTSGIYYGKHPNLMIDKISMNSASNDLDAIAMQELVWPTKVVQVESAVSHSLPGKEDIIETTVTRNVRVPMEPAEAVEHFAKMAGLQVELLSEGKIKVKVGAKTKTVKAPGKKGK